MSQNFIQVDTVRTDSRVEDSGSITRTVNVPEIVDCTGLVNPGFSQSPDGLWCNQRCGNDSFYAQPIPPNENIKIQTRFWDTKNFKTIGPPVPEGCEGQPNNTIRWKFRITDPGVTWGQRLANGVCNCGQFDNGSSSIPGPEPTPYPDFTAKLVTAPQAVGFYNTDRFLANLQGGCANNLTEFANGLLSNIDNTGCEGGIRPCVPTSIISKSLVMVSPTVAEFDILFDYDAMISCFSFVCELPLLWKFAPSDRDNNGVPYATPYSPVITPIYEAIIDWQCCNYDDEPVESPCYLFGNEGCEVAEEGVATYTFNIPNTPGIIYGAANQAAANTTDGGFIFDILNTGCAGRIFPDVPAELRLSSATDYTDYISNVLGWLQTYVGGFGTSTVAENSGTFTIRWDIDHFDGLNIDICSTKAALCPLSSDGCLFKEQQKRGFVILDYDETSPHTYTLYCGNTEIGSWNFVPGNGTFVAQFLDWWDNSFPMGVNSADFGDEYIRLIWPTALYPEWCDCELSITSPTDPIVSIQQIDNDDCCEIDCCKSIDGYRRLDLVIPQAALNDWAANDIESIIYIDCGGYIVDAGPMNIAQPTVEAIVTVINRNLNNGSRGDIFGRGYIENGVLVGVSIYIAEDFGFFGCPCEKTIIYIEDQNGNRYFGKSPDCCETNCTLPCDVSHTQITLSGLDTLTYGDPDNDVCLYVLPSTEDCPAGCDTNLGVCISESAFGQSTYVAQFRDYLINLALGGNQAGFIKYSNNFVTGVSVYDLYLPRDIYPCPSQIQVCQSACVTPPAACSGIVRYAISGITLTPGAICQWNVAYQCGGPSYTALFTFNTNLPFGEPDPLQYFVDTFNVNASFFGIGIEARKITESLVFFEFDCEWAIANCGLDCMLYGQLRIQSDCGNMYVSSADLCTLSAGGGGGEPQEITVTVLNDGNLECCDVDPVETLTPQTIIVNQGPEPNPLCCPPYSFKLDLIDCCGEVIEGVDPTGAIVNQYAAKYGEGDFTQGLEIDPTTLPACFGLQLLSDAGETLLTECYIKECCLPLVKVCGNWGDGDIDCDGNRYDSDYEEICGEWFRHDDCMFVRGELKPIGYDIDTDTKDASTSRTLSKRYRFRTEALPPYEIDKLSRRFMAPSVTIDGKTFVVDQQSFNEDRFDQGSNMMKLSIELTEDVCERVDGC